MRWRKGKNEDADDEPRVGATDDEGRQAAPGALPTDVPDDTPLLSDVPDAAPIVTPQVHIPVHEPRLNESDLTRARRRAVARALAEDLGDRGDITSLAVLEPGVTGEARIVARADGTVAGIDIVREVFGQVDARVEVDLAVADGDEVLRGATIARLSGPLRSILTGERTALNFLGHLSGIATHTHSYVQVVQGTGVALRDTRKTTPGLRLLEKAAVAAGGGTNHRLGLHDAILIKDNHVNAVGDLRTTIEAALDRRGTAMVQVEVTSVAELEVALDAGATDIMIDNFSIEQARHAVQLTAGRARLEASGGITRDNVRAYAETGVDRIAIGALTHSAPNLDVALDVEVTTGPQAATPPVADEVGASGTDVTETTEVAAPTDAERNEAAAVTTATTSGLLAEVAGLTLDDDEVDEADADPPPAPEAGTEPASEPEEEPEPDPAPAAEVADDPVVDAPAPDPAPDPAPAQASDADDAAAAALGALLGDVDPDSEEWDVFTEEPRKPVPPLARRDAASAPDVPAAPDVASDAPDDAVDEVLDLVDLEAAEPDTADLLQDAAAEILESAQGGSEADAAEVEDVEEAPTAAPDDAPEPPEGGLFARHPRVTGG